MKRNTWVRPTMCLVVSFLLVLLAAMAVTPTAAQAGEAQIQRFIFASAGIDESNRFWTVSRPNQLQNDPYLETLLELDAKTSEYIPRLATKWESSPDMKEWTLTLRKGVPFHFGFGEFTAKDVVHSHSLMLREETVGTFAGFWRTVEEVKIIDDYTVVFRMKTPASTMPYALSRAGDLRMVSKAQWDQEGLEGFEQRPAGTGTYQYGGRQLGQSIWFERVEGNHWSGIRPDFQELEFRIVPEESTRLAMLLRGEAHAGDLSRELHGEAEKRGLKVMAASLAAEWVSVYLGGMWFVPGDPKFNPNVPWTDKRVRQAMNMAINRPELHEHLFGGKGELMYVSGLAPFLEGYNPQWAQRFDQLYGYNPKRARELLKEAGYPAGTLKATIWSFAQLAKPEIPQLAEAVAVYFQDVGIDATLDTIDVAHLGRLGRTKERFGIWPNMIALRPTEEMIRIAHTTGASAHLFESEFLEKKYAELTQTVEPEARERVAREITDYLFEEFTSIPLFTVPHEVVVNPKIVAGWTWPGQGAGRTTHFDLIKAVR